MFLLRIVVIFVLAWVVLNLIHWIIRRRGGRE
jgi:hypothetical protein